MERIEISPLAKYRARLEDGVLSYQVSRADGRAIFYPRIGPDLEWRDSAGLGTVYSATIVAAREGAYTVALVDCDEGFRLMSRIEEIAPEDVWIGMRVTFKVGRDEKGAPIPLFVPTS